MNLRAVLLALPLGLATAGLLPSVAHAQTEDGIEDWAMLQTAALEAYQEEDFATARALAEAAISSHGGPPTSLSRRIVVEVLLREEDWATARAHLDAFDALEGLAPEERAWSETAHQRLTDGIAGVEPDPIEPDPSEPDPTEPEPTEPEPSEPGPTEPEDGDGTVQIDPGTQLQEVRRTGPPRRVLLARRGAGVAMIGGGLIPLIAGMGHMGTYGYQVSGLGYDHLESEGWLVSGAVLAGIGVALEAAGIALATTATRRLAEPALQPVVHLAPEEGGPRWTVGLSGRF